MRLRQKEKNRKGDRTEREKKWRQTEKETDKKSGEK